MITANEDTKKHVSAINYFSDQVCWNGNNLIILSLKNFCYHKDFKVICDASISLLKDNNKFEKLRKFNESLKNIPNCKDVTKWLLNCLIALIKQKSDNKRVFQEFTNFGLVENKANILQKAVFFYFTFFQASSVHFNFFKSGTNKANMYTNVWTNNRHLWPVN